MSVEPRSWSRVTTMMCGAARRPQQQPPREPAKTPTMRKIWSSAAVRVLVGVTMLAARWWGLAWAATAWMSTFLSDISRRLWHAPTVSMSM